MNLHRGLQLQVGADSDSFLLTSTIHLRYSRLGEDKLHLVKGLSHTGGILLVQWTRAAADQGIPPAPNQEVDIYAMRQGVLYITKGTVVELRTAGQLRVWIKVKSAGRRVTLRKHQRYIVRGILSMGPVNGEFSLVQQSDAEMDISLGGFGCLLPGSALADQAFVTYAGPAAAGNGDIAAGLSHGAGVNECSDSMPGRKDDSTIELRARIKLEVFVEHRGRINPHRPSVTLNCNADIRRRNAVAGTTDMCVGFKFIDMPPEQRETLNMWLTAHNTYLREC